RGGSIGAVDAKHRASRPAPTIRDFQHRATDVQAGWPLYRPEPPELLGEVFGGEVKHRRAAMRACPRGLAVLKLADQRLHLRVAEHLPGFDGRLLAHPRNEPLLGGGLN